MLENSLKKSLFEVKKLGGASAVEKANSVLGKRTFFSVGVGVAASAKEGSEG